MSAVTLERIRQRLVGLKMPFALEHLDRLVRQLEAGEINALEAIETLLSEKLLIRENRRIKMGLTTSALMPPKSQESFDFTFQPSLDRGRIDALASLEFTERREVVHFLGPPGTGNSNLACALGVAAVKSGKTVYRSTLTDLVGNLFFQLVSARYEKGAMILTSNRGDSEWGEVFGDPVIATALLDRLLHHAVVIRIVGVSYRLREHRDLIAPLPNQTSTSSGRKPRGRPKKR